MSNKQNDQIVDDVRDYIDIEIANGRIKPEDFEKECGKELESRMNQESIEVEMDDNSMDELEEQNEI